MQFSDTQYMTAAEKALVLKEWERFLRSSCARSTFTKRLYEHLHLHCSFIAHYDINGFYSTYFEHGDTKKAFLSQFDITGGMPKSIEYGGDWWLYRDDYYDLNIAMCNVATRYILALTTSAGLEQRQEDLLEARRLLSKHGVEYGNLGM